MDVHDRNKLRRNHRHLKRTISTRYITGYLYEKGTLTIDDVDRINQQATEEDKTETLLFMLPRKGPAAFRNFCMALKEKYDGVPLYKEVADKLESTLSSDEEKEGEQGASAEIPEHVARWDLLRKHRRDIATCLDTDKTCWMLIDADVLTERERNVIEREDSLPERAETLLRILPTKGPNAFRAFCKALEDQERRDLAALLAGEPGRVYNPVTNVTKTVGHFFTSGDAGKVHDAMGGERSLIVLSGITGSGKTQLALWQAQLFIDRFPTAVVWRIDGRDKHTFVTDKQNLLQALKEKVPTDDSKVDACVAKALDSRGTPVLLILDDLDDGLLLSQTILKERPDSKTLLITHRKRLQQPANVSITDDSYTYINGFAEEEAVDFLRLQLQPPQYPTDELQRLAGKFSGLPLGLAAARSYIRNSHTSAENYLTLLEQRKTASKIEEDADKWMSQFYDKPELLETGRNLFAALRLAVSKLEPQAKSMFQLTAYMDRMRIPIVVLKDDVKESPAMRNLALNSLVMQVEDLSLGTVSGIDNDRVLTVHEVTQLVMRLSITEHQEKDCLKKLLDILLKYFSKDNRYTKSGKLTELLKPHVGKALEYTKEHNDDGSFYLALARLSEVYGFMHTQDGMPGNAEEHLRAAKKYIEDLAGINWRDVHLEVDQKLREYGSFISLDEQGRVEEKSMKEAEVLYWKLSAASKRLPDEVYTSVIHSKVIAEQDLALFHALGKTPAGLAESVRNKEPLTPKQYKKMVEDGIAIPTERMKEVFLPELYASINYTLGRCFFYLKDKYTEDMAAKDRLIKSIQHAYYVSVQIKKHAGVSVLHKYLAEANALLYLRLEETGKSPEEQRRDIKHAISRYSEFVEGRGEYFEFGVLKKSGQDKYSLMNCHRQLVKCFNKLIKLSDTQEERLACYEHAHTECRKMIEYAEQQVLRDDYGKIVERPERLADYYNTAGTFLADDGDRKKLDEAIGWYEKAYELEKEKEKEDYPLSDALFGLAQGLARRNEGDDLENAERYVRELLELYHRKWPGKKEDIERAKQIEVHINQLK